MTEKAYTDKEIIALFDYTNNAGAQAFLKGLFDRSRLTYEDVVARQQLLRTFAEHWSVLEKFSYQRYDFEEVYQFTTTLKNHYGEEGPDRITLMLSKDKHRIKGGCAQVVLLLDRLYTLYFQQASQIKFPPAFQVCIDRIMALLNGMEVEQLAVQVKRGTTLSINDTLHLLKWLVKRDTVGEMFAFWQSMFEYEAYWSVAKGIRLGNFVFPVFTTGAFLLEDFYHPTLKQPVRNNFTAGNEVVLLTGPNMSGKSTVLKAVSICVLLAHLGFAVPASKCEIPFYEAFLIAVNVTDDIKSGYSHFMQEIINLKNILQQATEGKRCFAVFDELFCGTNIDDAIDITCTAVKGLANFKGSFFMISTHLYQLDELLPQDCFAAYQLEAMMEAGMPRYTYVLKKGWSQLKFGKLLFEKEGLHQLLGGIIE
ncbi:MutS-related protein [Chitinophaga qingshengii]|uniref:DNA mismatch repair proteins mutS family domain-containing protein n=1 Tax=Chitinophaga qingshengii TaxID=1569794 RepID=A0ABR7TJQ8_9BACT|nr:hypothetical protein [Chitinophaga qingshengii]MBC9929771.1 hypothetical protein [Chitinophaga qingshengii]